MKRSLIRLLITRLCALLLLGTLPISAAENVTDADKRNNTSTASSSADS